MPLIIEDGSMVANANSFATDAEFLAYAALRGFTVPSTESERVALLIMAMDYLFNVESKLSGDRVSVDQELPYPRVGACAKNFIVPSTGAKSIPEDIKKAQIELAIQANTSDILISGTSNNLSSFNVDGVYSESYFSGGSISTVRADRANAYLKPYMINGGSKKLMRRV